MKFKIGGEKIEYQHAVSCIAYIYIYIYHRYLFKDHLPMVQTKFVPISLATFASMRDVCRSDSYFSATARIP